MGQNLDAIIRHWLSSAQDREREKIIAEQQREREVRALELLAQKKS